MSESKDELTAKNDRAEKERQKVQRMSTIHKEEEQLVQTNSGSFGINILEIESLFGAYKERTDALEDLSLIEKYGGPDGIMRKLKTDPKKGISSIDNRENDFGSNRIFIEPVPNFCVYVCEALEDLMIRILIVAAIVQIILGATLGDNPSQDWVDGMSIVIAVLVVTLVGSITNYNKEKKFRELNVVQNEGTVYKVIRNGQPLDMKSDDILVGDLINIIVGDIFPADLLLIEGNGIKVDESSLTGESDNLNKDSLENCNKSEQRAKGHKCPSPCLLSGTNCVEGSGLAIVMAVGDHSQKGIIKRTVDNAQENSQTPLEQKLESIAESIGYFGMAAGAITLVALLIRFGVVYVKDMKEYNKASAKKDLYVGLLNIYPEFKNTKEIFNAANRTLTNPKKEIPSNILNIVMLCVSIIVVAIPEGLPLAVTLSLAFSIKKLMDNNNLVRKMHACETMGGANYICTDKTGTLTKNEMNVFKVLTAESEIILKETIEMKGAGELNTQSAEAKNREANRKIRESHNEYFKSDTYFNILKTSIALNIDGQIKKLDAPDVNGDTEECETKNKTDKAFIDFLYRFRVSISTEKDTYLSDHRNYKQMPFDSKNKRMTTYVKNENFPTGFRLFSKGAGERIKNTAKYYIDPNTGAMKELTSQNWDYIISSIEKFNKQMLRSLYVCYKDISEAEYERANTPEAKADSVQMDQCDLVFLGCVGIRDSLRNGVKEAVSKCHRASVNVIMVTGDNIVTATAIAKDCGILGSDVNLDNLKDTDIEPDVLKESSGCKSKTDFLIKYKPQALTGNSFYTAIGGLMCDTCKKDTNFCKCPKTQAEAKEIAKSKGKDESEAPKIKNDTIKNKKVFYDITRNLKVMARSQPIHKYALVLGLKELNQVVSVTGDGTNDAPALSKSNVGFSMFAGTDIAREASDIVILDNNFSSIVVAIIYGRNIYDNIRKFLQFQLTVNFCACVLVFVCACVGNETPLTTIQMLWINLIMDSLGSLALATEPPYDELLDREPTRKGESIISGIMWKHIIIQSVVQLILLLVLYLVAPKFIKENNLMRRGENQIIEVCYGQTPGNTNVNNIIYGITPKWDSSVELVSSVEDECGKYSERQDLKYAYKEYIEANSATVHLTMVFNIFVIYTLFNQLNCRILNDNLNIFIRIQNNVFFPVIVIFELALQVILVEFGSSAFKCVYKGLTGNQWGICIGFSAITFVLRIIIVFIPIDKPIQNLLDKSLPPKDPVPTDTYFEQKGNDLIDAAKTDDLKKDNKSENTEVLDKSSNNDQKSRDSFLNKMITKSLRKGSSISITDALRKQKPEIRISSN